MKILKALAIAYLVWALLYSLTSGRAWVADALAFKLNGGPELVHQLEKAGYSIDGVQIDKKNRFLSLALSRQGLSYGRSVELTYLWGKDAVAKATKKPLQERTDMAFFSFKKLGKNWAILVGLVKESKANPSPERGFIKSVKIKPLRTSWYPSSEYQFLMSTVRQISYRVVVPEVLNKPTWWISTFTVYPVLSLHTLIVAYSPPKIIDFTVYLPILLFFIPLALFAKRRSFR